MAVPYENASPEQIERMIVRPVEDALGSLQGLRDMYARCDAPRFRVDDVACRGDTCFLGWTFEFHRGGRGTTITGVSRQ